MLGILAIDLGTKTGWALRDRAGIVTSGTQDFRPQRFEGGGMRYLRFRRWLSEVLQSAGGLDAVYYEEVRHHAGVDAAHAYGGFLATLAAWCEHHGIPYQGVPVGTIKKHATGKGNASKAEMVSAIRALGHRPADDNEADSLALLGWAIEAHRLDADGPLPRELTRCQD
jgi:Holliday junction resolvasome RuvABC endonuclease subunit